ncbi:sugar phosphate nucleotidyltransferase [Nannocystis sp.]|uniref:sugar phosphate nucleotidyltransferase n=1 Tax=Nannocystis sp. TaxID=1962667 RepID=UPI0025EB8A2B|nr:sugar phosphate nucleotidyltransferase [Nannocystis sp.]MBK7825700.1 hypothetical protein [Nannocystis sp.]
MAGGGGTRLWPASTPTRPKQLLQLSERPPSTLLAAAVERARRLVPLERIFVVTNIALVPAVEAAVPDLPPANVIPEPRPRSTAPCVALALLHVRQRLRIGLYGRTGRKGHVDGVAGGPSHRRSGSIHRVAGACVSRRRR